MNRVKAILTLSAALLGAAASAPAFAWHHGGVRFGVVVGAPFYPWYYPPYYYYPPYAYAPVAPAAPETPKPAVSLPLEFAGLQFPKDGVMTRQWMEFLSQMSTTK